MNENISIAPSGAYNLKNYSKMRCRPYSSNQEKKNFNRVLSTGNINNANYSKNLNIFKNYNILPSLNNNNNSTIIIKKKNKNKSMTSKKNQFKIELEKLYDQNTYYKKTIQKLQSEINTLKLSSTNKQNILNSMNDEIEKIINENKGKNNEITTENIPFSEQGKYTMIKKMRNQIKETEQELNIEILKNKNLKKDLKYTKFNELEIEKNIINEQTDKISILIQNSYELKYNQDQELLKNKTFIENLESQKNIINNFEQKLNKLNEEEKFLQNEIIKYENILNKTNNKVKIIKLKQISLKDLNTKLTKEQKDFIIKNKDNNYNLEILQNKLNQAKNDYCYYKIKNKKTTEKLNNIKKNYNFSLEQYKRIEKKIPKLQNDENSIHKIEYNKNNLNKYNNEEYINKLKKTYQENKDIENELEQNLFLFQEAIQKMNNGENIDIEQIRNNIIKIIKKKNSNYKYPNENNTNNNQDNNDNKDINNINNDNDNNNINEEQTYNDLALSVQNPFYSNDEENDPITSKKFNNEQFRQFTYILFKNFEAKKLNYEKGKNEIIIPLKNYYKSITQDNNNIKNNLNETNIQEKLSIKFCDIVFNLLNCNNEQDKIRIKLFFNAIYFDKVINQKNNNINNTENSNKLNLLSNYFLSLFNYINDYSEKDENILKQRLKINYNIPFIKLKNILKEYISSKTNNSQNENNNINDYISIQEIKYILDSNTDIKLKDRYIEYIIYYMKQFDDNNASLYDLKISKLDEIINEVTIGNNNNKNTINNDNNSNNDENQANESVEEVSPEEYNKTINSVLVIIKQLMIDENKNLNKLFLDSIVKINKPKPNMEVITLESFNDELNKRNVNLNNIQMSCINNKYCINEELRALDLKQMEEDINNLKENEINNYL